MCQLFDTKPITPLASMAVPNGKYRCYGCGYSTDPESGEQQDPSEARE